MRKRITIYTDGSYRDLKHQAILSCYGYVAVHRQNIVNRTSGEVYHPDFLQMEAAGAELTAILRALEWAESNDYQHVVIKTDDRFAYFLWSNHESIKRSHLKAGHLFFRKKLREFTLRGNHLEIEYLQKSHVLGTKEHDYHLLAHQLSRKMIKNDEKLRNVRERQEKRALFQQKEKKQIKAAAPQADSVDRFPDETTLRYGLVIDYHVEKVYFYYYWGDQEQYIPIKQPEIKRMLLHLQLTNKHFITKIYPILDAVAMYEFFKREPLPLQSFEPFKIKTLSSLFQNYPPFIQANRKLIRTLTFLPFSKLRNVSKRKGQQINGQVLSSMIGELSTALIQHTGFYTFEEASKRVPPSIRNRARKEIARRNGAHMQSIHFI